MSEELKWGVAGAGMHRTDMDRGVHVWAMHLPPFQGAGVKRAWGERMLEDRSECAERGGRWRCAGSPGHCGGVRCSQEWKRREHT